MKLEPLTSHFASVKISKHIAPFIYPKPQIELAERGVSRVAKFGWHNHGERERLGAVGWFVVGDGDIGGY